MALIKNKKRTCVIDGRVRVESRILRHWYEEFNVDYFYAGLPEDCFLFWDENIGRQDAYGRWYSAEDTGSGFPAIAITSSLRAKNAFGGTLLHEMIHVKVQGGHGRRFEKERRRLLRYRGVRDIVI
jgi:hypothetical protein